MTTPMLHVALLLLSLGTVKDAGQQAGVLPRVHAFGGEPFKIDLVVEPSNGAPLGPMEIQADLYQKGQTLLAPVQKDIAVAKAARFDGGGQAFLPLIPWTVQLPAVKRETEMVARLRMKSGNGEWTPSGQILVTVYPQGMAKEALLALSRERGLHIFAESKPLRDFLKAQEVAFGDAGDDLVSLPSNPEEKGVYLGEATPRAYADWMAAHPGWPGNLVVFCRDASLMPGVFVMTRGGYQSVKVTLPLLETLSSDPRSQKTFLEILSSLPTP